MKENKYRSQNNSTIKYRQLRNLSAISCKEQVNL